jgi:hypothetical protein
LFVILANGGETVIDRLAEPCGGASARPRSRSTSPRLEMVAEPDPVFAP